MNNLQMLSRFSNLLELFNIILLLLDNTFI